MCFVKGQAVKVLGLRNRECLPELCASDPVAGKQSQIAWDPWCGCVSIKLYLQRQVVGQIDQPLLQMKKLRLDFKAHES